MKLFVNSKSIEGSFIKSALTCENRFQTIEEFMTWFHGRNDANSFRVEEVPFAQLDKWSFEPETGNLVHDSGKFFSIEGLKVSTDFGPSRFWEQPIINQPEIGILGIITKVFDGVRYFLMQAKMEPGNVNLNQLSPTLQATKSNYRQEHKGKRPLFLDYFLDRSRSKIIIDQLQSEQGARFLRKRNRNMIIEVEEEFEIPDDFKWLTLGELKKLQKIDNFINMDSRTVLSCIPLIDKEAGIKRRLSNTDPETSIELLDQEITGFSKEILLSLYDRKHAVNSKVELLSWFTELKTKYELNVESISLKDVSHWVKTDAEIKHESKRLFSIIGVSVQAGNREVQSWSQPLVKQESDGIVGFIGQKINGVLHFLVQAKMETGYLDMFELAPTVSFSDAEWRLKNNDAPPFAEYFLNPDEQYVQYSSLLSEEGGRFYHVQNRYIILELPESEEIEVPEQYAWMTLNQLLDFVQYSNYLNIEMRSLLSCLQL